ncbi:hypothetical protein [Thauera sp.]|jgi:hypothetical protein|uniref:hypothetical protein n=1 Tax=Thauera sp. TaxID=1905334 RepID=UPI002A3664BD|nr:hypothetical protein [Thauera sp.]MDX9885117.1 hypothetical protein [Thauera sp.]
MRAENRAQQMDQRVRVRLRRLIDLCVDGVSRGVMPMQRAAQTMESAGAPFEVVCRVLMPFKNGTATPADGSAVAHPSVQHWKDVAAR